MLALMMSVGYQFQLKNYCFLNYQSAPLDILVPGYLDAFLLVTVDNGGIILC